MEKIMKYLAVKLSLRKHDKYWWQNDCFSSKFLV